MEIKFTCVLCVPEHTSVHIKSKRFLIVFCMLFVSSEVTLPALLISRLLLLILAFGFQVIQTQRARVSARRASVWILQR